MARTKRRPQESNEAGTKTDPKPDNGEKISPPLTKPLHACQICWPRMRGVGRLMQASVSRASLACTQCNYLWSIDVADLNEVLRTCFIKPEESLHAESAKDES